MIRAGRVPNPVPVMAREASRRDCSPSAVLADNLARARSLWMTLRKKHRKAAPMGKFRAFLHDHPRLAALLLATALCLKALVPGGYMLGQQANFLTVEICADASGSHADHAIAIPISGKEAGSVADHGAEHGAEHGRANQTCPYSALAMASLAGADTLLLAAALAFAVALGFLPVAPARARRASRLRPPLRGPPSRA